MAKKVTRKKSASEKRVPRVVEDAKIDDGANNDAIASKDASKSGKPKIHAKVVNLTVSIGSHDRNRTHEEFVEGVLKKLGRVPYGQDGIHATITGGYYILDGKVCLPEDYDKKTGTFKKGAIPPTWAGGVKPLEKTPQQEQMQRDAKELSSDEYDKKYGLGKYRRGDPSKVITPAMQKQRREEMRKDKQRREEEEIEEILDDDEVVEELVNESASKIVRRIKKTPKKRVVKKPAAKTEKKVIRRMKK